MKAIILLLSLLLNSTLLRGVAAQEKRSVTAAPTPTLAPTLTPEQVRSSISALYSALATSAPQQPGTGPAAGDVGVAGSGGDSNAGASGNDSGSIKLSQSAMIAIIVVIVVVCVFGIASSVLWYLAKKRSWEVRKKLRSSARKVATALTPRRTTFPKDVQNSRKSGRGLTKIEEFPRDGANDIEKGQPRMKKFEFAEPPKNAKWGKKTGQ